jgi:16S rRNA (cytosine967-C5)-methyltransferase
MGGNYRPRRRYGASGNAKATGEKAKEAGATGAEAGATRARAPRPADPRRTAYDVLAAVRDRAAYANLLLPKLLAERGLTGRDAAFATELTYGTLRGQGTYDAVLAACSDRPLAKLDPPVLDILRLGAHQLLNTRVGAHAAVATSVDLAKRVVGPRVSGYVNAVLRRVATRDLEAWLDIVAPNQATDPDGYLATRHSHPRWIVAAYRAALADAADTPVVPLTPTPAPADDPDGPLAPTPAPADDPDGQDVDFLATPSAAGKAVSSSAGDEPDAVAPEATGGAAVSELAAALAAGNARPRVTLATFPAGAPREDVMPADADPGRWSPYAFTIKSGDPTPLTESGAVAVQDEGSQLAAIALSRAQVEPSASQDSASQNDDGQDDAGRNNDDGQDDAGRNNGEAERWLDMCAGPGGKSRLLYGLASIRGARLTAAELHPHRATLVGNALAGARRSVAGQLPPFEVLVADATKPPWAEGTFDRVLVDAPCSGLGALRRRPEARWRKSETDLKELTGLQRDLLRSALTAVRPGGVVAYVTCSPVPAETTEVVTEVAASMPGIEILDAPAVLSEVPGVDSADPRFAQLWPHRHGTDAIFVALLRRAHH